MEDVQGLDIKALKLSLIDMLVTKVICTKPYIPYMAMYEEELEALVGLPEAEQRKG